MDCEGKATPQRGGRARLAVLIDGENASPRHARAVFAAAEALGEATVRRIYACIAPGSLDTSLSHAAGLSDIAVCHA